MINNREYLTAIIKIAITFSLAGMFAGKLFNTDLSSVQYIVIGAIVFSLGIGGYLLQKD